MGRFSIVICTYNGEKYLKKVLDSIFEMDDLEYYVDNVIVVDNASTDSTKVICNECAKKYTKLQYEYEPTPGLANARKHAAKVQSEWVIYFDDDNMPGKSWLVNADENIRNHKNLGAFGGRNIAMPESDCTENDLCVLEAVLSNLACHYMTYEDYICQRNIMSPKSVFGAGMTIRTEIIKRYLKTGWSLSIGRKKEVLSAYEDTEILHYVESLQYKVQAFDNLYLFHIIPKFRTNIDYVKKLRRGMSDSEKYYIDHQREAVKLRVKKIFRNCYRIFKYSLLRLASRKNRMKKLRYRLYVDSALYEMGQYLWGKLS